MVKYFSILVLLLAIGMINKRIHKKAKSSLI